MLIITGIFQLADGMQAIVTAALRGLNDTKIPAIIGLFGYWGAGIGSGAYMAFILDWGPVAIWAGLAVGLFVNAVILGYTLGLAGACYPCWENSSTGTMIADYMMM